jgi:hypothetical protein
MPDQATEWHDLAHHLTRGHGTNPAAIVGYGPTLPQLEREHWVAHLTSDSTGLAFQHTHHPHTHANSLPEGQAQRTPGTYAPFPASPHLQRADPWRQAQPEPEAEPEAEAGL